jgi:putative protease
LDRREGFQNLTRKAAKTAKLRQEKWHSAENPPKNAVCYPESVPQKPEIMSPAGYWPQLRTAIEAGADAVYFGLTHFTARAKVGFTLEELPEAMRTLHQRGVKGYVTFNTLLFDDEIDEAARTLAAIAEAGADSIIVQDLGAVKLAREVAPGLEIHGSTQMSVTSADGVRFAQSLGVSRVVMARELSLEEIRKIRAETDCELEIFVHGALCVSYSGQCFSSEAWGGRSANRGQCAQACRLPYEMIVDGAVEPLADARYLLSPGDLFALRQIPEIVDIGVSALKIEGRYKDSDYVALTTRAYRQAVDDAWSGRAGGVDRATELQLEQVYSRGFGPHFLTGTNHQAVVSGRAPRHRGVFMGRVTRVFDGGVLVAPSDAQSVAPLKPGDGVVFDPADWRSPEEREEGGRVFEVVRRDGGVELKFGNGAVDAGRIRRGDWVWRTHDVEIDRAARPYIDPPAPVRKQIVDVRVRAVEGARLETVWTVGECPVTVVSPEELGKAQNRALDADYLRAQLGRLGNTAYELGEVTVEVEGNPFAPASLLNQMRREAVDRLQEAQGAQVARTARAASVTARHASSHTTLQPDASSRLHLLVRTAEQLEAAIAARPDSITIDYLDLYGVRPSLERIRAAGVAARIAGPRVLKPGEERIADFLLSCDCPILARSAGLLHSLRGRAHPELIADFSLNAANAITAGELFELGIARLTPTHDLNGAQIADLAQATDASGIEVVAYHHLPVFHTEHCVFCRFLSTGTSYRDCGRPCEQHTVALRDANGRAHPVMADVGCRNTVFGAEAQQAAAHTEEWLAAGIRHFRLEFAHETADQTSAVAEAFRRMLEGRASARELAQTLQRIAPQGVTEGSLFVPEGQVRLTVLQ